MVFGYRPRRTENEKGNDVALLISDLCCWNTAVLLVIYGTKLQWLQLL